MYIMLEIVFTSIALMFVQFMVCVSVGSVEVNYSSCPPVVFSGVNSNVADLSASFLIR